MEEKKHKPQYHISSTLGEKDDILFLFKYFISMIIVMFGA